jgi:ABC-type sugar transport system ATPase subunit
MAWWKRERTLETGAPAADAAALPLIRLEGVTKIFRTDGGDEPDTRALDDVTLDIDRGEYVSVSGPSGCGKSTFLSILALLDAPTSGRYWFNGRRVDTVPPGDKARIRNVDVGLIFQSFNLIGDMTVYENVEYPLTLRGTDGTGGARGRGARPRRAVGAREAASGVAVGRPPATGGDRPRDRRPSADCAGRRAHGQPRLEERRVRDADARGAERRRRHHLPGDAQSGLHRAHAAAHQAVRRPGGGLIRTDL